MDIVFKNKERLDYLDLSKGLAIILVVLGHIDLGDNPLCIWIYSFHLPLFFIASGVLIAYKGEWIKKSFLQIAKIKALQLLYPYFTFSIIALLWRLVYSGDYKSIIHIIFTTISFDGYSTLWFLPSLFISELMFIFFLKYKYKNIIYGLITIIGIIGTITLHSNLLPSNNFLIITVRCIIAMSFVWIGFLYFRSKKNCQTKKNTMVITGCIMFLLNVFMSQFNGRIDLHYSIINNPVLYYLCAISGSLSVLVLFESTLCRNSILKYYGENSLIVMATHLPLPLLGFSSKVTKMTSLSIGRYPNDIVILTVALLMEIFIIEIINRYMKFIIKGTYKTFNIHFEKNIS